jgi:hypothetical protein
LRARALLESLLDARVDLRQDIEPALLDRERIAAEAAQRRIGAAVSRCRSIWVRTILQPRKRSTA